MTQNFDAEKDAQPTWPREIWMLARDEDDQGYTCASLSEFGGGDEADLHRYVDADIHDSAEKYWRARLVDAKAEIARLKSDQSPSSVADNLIASANDINDKGARHLASDRKSALVFPGRIMSLIEMLQLDTRPFLASLTMLSGALGQITTFIDARDAIPGATGVWSVKTRAQVLKAVQDLEASSEAHGLKVTRRLAEEAYKELSSRLAGDGWTFGPNLNSVRCLIEGLVKTAVLEAEGRTFYCLPQSNDESIETADKLFGAQVCDVFPNAIYDIEEAGKCLAFSLWTACVMHCMRTLETALHRLAAHVGVPNHENWNKTLNEIEASLRSLRKSVHGPEAEQWAADAGTHLRFIKNAWRNDAMHGQAKYDDREAKRIFAETRSFMRTVAREVQRVEAGGKSLQ